MRTNVAFNDVKYIVKPEEKMVTCIMEADLQMNKTPVKYSYETEWIKETYPQADFNGVYLVKGIAKCNKDDKFDEQKGKRIAESKAKKMAFKLAFNIFDNIIEHLEKQILEMEDLRTGCYMAIMKEEDHLNELK